MLLESFDDLRLALKTIGEMEGGETFMGRPDRWWETPQYRCVNGHVSTRVLKSEELGRDACLASGCMEPLTLTFPEDVEGPLLALSSYRKNTDTTGGES